MQWYTKSPIDSTHFLLHMWGKFTWVLKLKTGIGSQVGKTEQIDKRKVTSPAKSTWTACGRRAHIFSCCHNGQQAESVTYKN